MLPPEDVAPVVAPAVVEPSPAVAPVVTVPVEPVVLENVTVAQSPSLPGESQSLLTSAATKAMKGKRVAAKSRVKATDEAHSTQP